MNDLNAYMNQTVPHRRASFFLHTCSWRRPLCSCGIRSYMMAAPPSRWSISACSMASTSTPPLRLTWCVACAWSRTVNARYEWIPAILSSTPIVRQVGMPPRTGFKTRDLFAKVDLGIHPTGVFQAMLDATSILMLKLTPL